MFPQPPRLDRRTVEATVSIDPGEGGGKVTLGLSGNQRYDLRRFQDLIPNALAFSISSASVSRRQAYDAESSLYLFSGGTPTAPGDYSRQIPQFLLDLRVQSPFKDFHGDFLRITLPAGAAGTSSLDDLTAAAFNDKTTSLMLVDRWKNGSRETTVSAANTFTAGYDLVLLLMTTVQNNLGTGAAIIKIQDPVFSWLAFPPPNQTLPTNYTYLVVAQWFVFHAWGFGTNAWLMLYFRFGRDVNSKLELSVVDMDYYVWPSIGAEGLTAALRGSKNSVMSALQLAATLILGNLAGTVCDDVYLLPGTQPNTKATVNATAKGSALSDVTIVLVNPR